MTVEREKKTCCICDEDFTEWGNNPDPVKSVGSCCDACNDLYVIPARLANMANPNPSPADIAWVVLNGDAIPLSNVTLIDIESDLLGRDLVTVQFRGSTHQSLVYLRQDRDAKMPLPAPQTPPDAS